MANDKDSAIGTLSAETQRPAWGSLPGFVGRPDPEIYRTGTYAVLDLETTNTDFGSALNPANQIVLGVVKIARGNTDRGRFHFDGKGAHILKGLLANVDFLVAHNAKFEIQWLQRIGAWRPMPVYDTMLAEAVWNANRRGALDLDYLARKYKLGAKSPLIATWLANGGNPIDMPPKWLDQYCEQDVLLTEQLMLNQLKRFEGTRLLPVVYTRCLLTPVLADIERNGMALDAAKVRGRFTEYNEKLNTLREDLGKLCGGINLNSSKQLCEFVYDRLGFAEPLDYKGEPIRTTGGQRTVGAEALSALNPTTDEQRQWLDLYRDYGTLRVNTDTLRKMLDCVEDAELAGIPPILYAYYTQHVTQTHRTSSRGSKYKLQFQNFNRDFKDLFTHRHPGWGVGEGDGRQLEFRVAAHLGRDARALADIHNPDFDVHYQTAEQILNKPRSKISKKQRTEVKPKTFRPLYAGNSGTPEEQRYYQFFRDRYSGIYNTQEAWTYEVAKNKKLETEWGFVFYWADCTILPSGRVTHRTNIFNYPIQSFATADIIPIGLVCMYYRMQSLGMESFIVNTVHDSTVGEVKKEEERLFRDICNYSLTFDTFDYLHSVYHVDLIVPLGAETKVGDYWGQGKEEKFDVDPLTRELIQLN